MQPFFFPSTISFYWSHLPRCWGKHPFGLEVHRHRDLLWGGSMAKMEEGGSTKTSPSNLHPWKLKFWTSKNIQLKRKIIFQTSSFGFHVSFPGRVNIFALSYWNVTCLFVDGCLYYMEEIPWPNRLWGWGRLNNPSMNISISYIKIM